MSDQSTPRTVTPPSPLSPLAHIRFEALGFAVGSVLFAAGALTAQFAPSSLQAANIEFAAGAVCFTAAAAVQAWVARESQVAAVGPWRVRDAFRNPDWLSAVAQFIGTLYLVSSLIAWHPVSRERRHGHVQRRSVWICQANLYGSIAFGVSVIGARYLVDGQLRNPAVANWATFVGAVFFFLGAILLLPRWNPRPSR